MNGTNSARRVRTVTVRTSQNGHAPAAREFRVQGERPWRYRVRVGPGLLAGAGAELRRAGAVGQVFVLTDRTVRRLHGAAFERALRAAGIRAQWLVVAPGERSKSLPVFEQMLDRLARLGCDRRALLVNFGGGVISDLGGYVAASWMRGVNYANVPTTLLAQVDAAVGGKVAVNTQHAKNLVGAFWHPTVVLADPTLLSTLPAREFRSGLAEIIKMAIIAGEPLAEMLLRERDAVLARDPAVLARLIHEGARAKMELIALDPHERDLRRPLNLGHTLGHPLETVDGYRGLRHGEAVAVGTAVATLIARDEGLCSAGEADAIHALLDAYGLLDVGARPDPDAILDALRFVRLIRGRALHFVLPRRMGAVSVVEELPDAVIRRGFRRYAALLAARA